MRSAIRSGSPPNFVDIQTRKGQLRLQIGCIEQSSDMQYPDVEFGFEALDRLLSNTRPLPVLHAHRQANDPVILEEKNRPENPKAVLTLFNTSSVGPISPFSSFERFACDTPEARGKLRLTPSPAPAALIRSRSLIEIGGHQS